MADRLRRRRGLWLSLAVLAVVTAVAVVGCAGVAVVQARRPLTLPEPTGPFGVGRVVTQWTDAARRDPLAPGAPDPARTLAVWAWYPTAHASSRPAPYAPGLWRQQQLAFPVGAGQSDFDRVRTHSTTSAPPAAGRFPVVVLEPGLGLAAPQYTVLAESIASHGYVVVAPTPTYSANLTVIDGRIVRASAAGNPRAFDVDDLHEGAAQRTADRLLGVWVADAQFAAATAGSTGGVPFAGHVEASTTFYVGHSFGGAAALEACRTDPSCRGAVDLDGTQFGDVVSQGLDRPFLLIAGDRGCVTGTCAPTTAGERADATTARTLLAAGRGSAWCVTIGAARHFDFSDYDAYYLAAPLRLLIPVGHLRRPVVLSITSELVVEFLDSAVSGDASGLEAAARRHAEVTVVHEPA